MSNDLSGVKAWWHVNAIVVAFMVGYMEQAMMRDHKIIPRYIEKVSGDIADALVASEGPMLYMTPDEVKRKLHVLSNRHYIVIEWRLNRKEACEKAAEYLVGKMAAERLQDAYV